MRGEERKRAGRNRTLSVTGEEVEQLRDLVSTLSDIERGAVSYTHLTLPTKLEV